MQVGLLGPLELIDDDDAHVAIPSRRQRQLLTVLAARRDQVVPVDVISDLLWGDEPPWDPAASVQTNVSRLRRLVGASLEITTHPNGYRLACPVHDVDASHFEWLVDRLRSTNHELTTRLAAEALALWRGVPFPDLDHPDIEAERQRLLELRLAAVDAYAAALGELGRHAEAIAVAETHVRDHPYRERAVATLMQSLYASGRQVDALEAFNRLRHRLLEDLGMDPSPQLRTLETAILRQDVDVAPVAATPEAIATPALATDPGLVQHRPGISQQIRFLTSEDGIRIAYATSGVGPPLVKAANWLTHLDYDWESPVWMHWLDGLSDHHQLVRYDERGCGLSDWEVATISFEAWVDDLEMVVDALDLDRFPLLGISQGGAVAIAYAVLHPERVSRLVLWGAYGQGRLARATTEEERRQAAIHVELARIGWGTGDPAFRQVFTSQFMPEGTKRQWDAFNELQRRTTSGANAVRFMEVFATIDVVDLAPQVVCPTLIMHARDEIRVPAANASHLAGLIPDSHLVLVPGRNHILLENEPAWPIFLDEVDRFLAEG